MNLEITLPDNIVITKRGININLDTPTKNVFQIDNVDYIPYFLDNSNPGNRGGNGIVLKLVRAQEFDEEEGYPEIPDLVIKICKIPFSRRKEKAKSVRFSREIDALVACNDLSLSNVIKVHHHGMVNIKFEGGYKPKYRYYTMDYAECDLSTHLKEYNPDFDERLDLCIEICQSLKQIWVLDYYHRDIKPDNILFVGKSWVISDLGLAEHREENESIDSKGEWIGPRGWMSPESMNKYLTEKSPWSHLFDCRIDHQSDIFQLGRVFWYIMQGNSPTAGIRRTDFRWRNESLYQVLRTMINNTKTKRYADIDEVINLLKNIQRKSLLSTVETRLY